MSWIVWKCRQYFLYIPTTFTVLSNKLITNSFKSDNNNIAYIKTQRCQIMTTITYIILKFESVIKKPIVANHVFFAVVTFNKINYFASINSMVIQHL